MTPRSLGHRYSYSVAQKSDCGAEGEEKSNWERGLEATQCTSMKIRGMWKYPQGPKPECTERVLKFSYFPLQVYKYTDMTLPSSSTCPAGKGLAVSHRKHMWSRSMTAAAVSICTYCTLLLFSDCFIILPFKVFLCLSSVLAVMLKVFNEKLSAFRSIISTVRWCPRTLCCHIFAQRMCEWFSAQKQKVH